MEVNRAESAAVAAVGGVPADVLDMAGRLVVSPNALTLDGQRNVPADLQPGESLATFLERHVPGIRSGAWTVMIGGAMVPEAMWAHTYPKHGQLIACRAVLRKSALQLVALAALTYFSGGIAGGIYGALGGTYVTAAAGMYLSAIQFGVFIAGSVLINKVLGPKIPSVQSQAQKQIYSLSDQRNTARPYEPIPVLWGEMRVTPDLASKSYAWYEGDDQYLSTILLGGINVHSAADLAIGDTPIGNYSDVSLYYNGFPGMPSQDVPLYSNVDAVAGAEFVNGGDWITRTGSAGAGVLQLDIEGQLYDVDNKGNIKPNSVDLTIEARVVGAAAWTRLLSDTLTNASTDVLRRTFSFDVAPGQYEVRAKLGVPRWNEGGSADACKFNWLSLKSVHADTTDYSQWGRIGIKIRASGQLNGSLDQVRATYRAKPMPIWTGTEWATATTRAEGLSNPGAILLQALRGVWATDSQGQRVLQFGFGLSDEQIDIEGLKAFMLHCAARGYTYDKWITPTMSLGAFCDEVALAGMGEFAWTDGSRPTAVFVTNGQPNSAVVNMANMLKGGFSVDYALSNAADGIEYQWLNRDTWEMTTLRVMAPGVTTMLSPARVTGEGITSEQHAAVMARYHLAQSLYQYKTVHYTADIEHLDYRRLSVLSVSHDLTQWGFGGRVMAAQNLGGAGVLLQLDELVPPMATAYIGLRVPGERDYRVFQVDALEIESDWVRLTDPWPADLDFPGEGIGNPAHDTLWCYDFKATPGYRVRVTGIDPESDLKGARITAVPEGPEFWDYVLNGTYVPAPNQSSIPQLGRPVVKNLRVSEKVNLQGDTEWYELSCIWDVEGDYDHAQVWAGRDGSELRLVDGNAVGNRSTFRIDGAGEWLIEVRPFNPAGRAGQMAVKLYITSQTQLPPRNPGTFVVQQVEGGLRRFAWAYAGDKPAALAGVQIRFIAGEIPLSVDMWGAMQPLGEADDIYTAQFETSKPQAGLWTFGLRAIDTAGQLANGIVRFSIELDQSFDQIQQPDLTPPPQVTGLAAVGMFTSVQVTWDAANYSQGHGHARTIIYAAEGAGAQFAAARQVAEAFGGPASFTSDPATVWSIWAKHQSVDGVLSDLPAGPVIVETGQDLQKVQEALGGHISESWLANSLGQRIDLLDKDNGPLGRSLVTAAQQQDALNQSVRGNINQMAEGLLEAALAADKALERITDAGVYVDPATGQVKIYGLEQTNEHVTTLQILLDAVQGQMLLKASTAYVDGKIAEAVLSPADLLLYEGIDARLITVTQELDSINGRLTQKADALELQGALVRLTTAESNLDALGGQIALRVTRAEYQADQDALQQRMGSAELTLNALDVPAITATVTATRRNERDAEKTAEALLRDILSGERNREQAADALAFARNQLSAAITDGLAAEAQQRLELAAVVGAQGAALTQESKTRADADAAEAQARQQLAAETQRGQQSLSAAIDQEATTRADAVSAEASQRQQLQAVVEGNHDAAMQAAQAASDAAGGKGKVIFGSAQPAAEDRLPQNLWIDTTGGANTPKRWSGAAWIVATDKVATDAAAAAATAQSTANNAVAAIHAEQSVRANETGHLGALYSVRMQLSQGGQQVVGGFALSGTSNGTAGPTIDFGVMANSFWIAAPSGSPAGVSNVRPFSVQTTAQTINGVVVPAGVYMDAVYINNVDVILGRFGTLLADKIQATAISASQLTAGNGVIGGSLKSSNYVTGSSGWILRPDGMAEFSGVIVRGTIYSTAGSIGGITINANGLNAGAFTGYAWPAGTGTGFHLGPNGLLLGNPSTGRYVELGRDGYVSMPGFNVINGNATFSGRLEAASGTFAGALQAATGSFSGVLTASAINAVNTINIAGGAISANAAAYSAGDVSFSNYDTEVEIASVNFTSSGGSVMALVGFGLTASGGVTSSFSPLIRVRLRRDGIEVRRIDLPCEVQTNSNESGYFYTSRIVGMPISLPPLTDTPGAGFHTFSVTVEARMMGNSVNVTTRNRGISIMEIKR
ncbi:phage tail tip fiber protein [Comamonas testosteroni]|uniref:Uncharacterized protein n=1 Tax=Comamonas testosteroni TaxID=285 RepID=A0A096FCU1_COMTE|nr:DUF1983 domain-containing protein [Comamonas testosteroni]KGH27764.1 hypothetical protein P353_17240 [Comamonas testosteroni]